MWTGDWTIIEMRFCISSQLEGRSIDRQVIAELIITLMVLIIKQPYLLDDKSDGVTDEKVRQIANRFCQ